MIMTFFYLKALHIIFVVTWFSGLFYIVRLFIYHKEAIEKNLEGKDLLINQFLIMEKRLWYGITWPSCILTLIFGSSLLSQFWPISNHPWLMAKLFFVFFLLIYHLICGRMLNNLKNNKSIISSQKLRIWNEGATLFLIAIVFLVVLKNLMAPIYGLLGLIGLTIVLFMAIKVYKNLRTT